MHQRRYATSHIADREAHAWWIDKVAARERETNEDRVVDIIWFGW